MRESRTSGSGRGDQGNPVPYRHHRDVALATLHQTGELAGHRAASECKELDRHRRLGSADLADIARLPLACDARIVTPSALSNGKTESRADIGGGGRSTAGPRREARYGWADGRFGNAAGAGPPNPSK